MIFLLLTEVANRYRTIFADGDYADFKEALRADFDANTRTLEGFDKIRAKNKMNSDLLQYKQQNEALAESMQRTVAGYFQAMTEEGQKNFMSVADTLQFLTMELNNSKNRHQMLSVCQLYNAGILDGVFKEIEEQKKKQGVLTMQNPGIVDVHGNTIST